eukprot:10483756-Ditylum_brightwellii.AAC.1
MKMFQKEMHYIFIGNSVPVFVDVGGGIINKATVSAWCLTTPFPDKPKTFAHVLVSQKPDVDKLIMKLVYGGTRTATRSAGVLDYIGEQCEKAEK